MHHHSADSSQPCYHKGNAILPHRPHGYILIFAEHAPISSYSLYLSMIDPAYQPIETNVYQDSILSCIFRFVAVVGMSHRM